MQSREQHRILELIRHYAEGNLTETDSRQLWEWRKASPENDRIFRYLMSREHFQESVRRFVKLPEEEAEQWERILSRTVRQRRNKLPLFSKYAALLILFLSIPGLWYWQQYRERKPAVDLYEEYLPGNRRPTLVLTDGSEVLLTDNIQEERLKQEACLAGDTLKYDLPVANGNTPSACHTLKVPRGGDYVLWLSDGTKVYINAASELTYPVRFDGEERRVELKGEAYFEITPDPRKPFIVMTGRNRIEALGTSFGIRAYEEENFIRTTLVSGRVKVSAPEETVVLTPGEQAFYEDTENRLRVEEVNVQLYVGWKDGRLIFDNQPLEKILKDLGRWYLFDVIYVNKKAADIPFSLNIEKSEHINQVLELLEKTTKVKFKIDGNMVIVK